VSKRRPRVPGMSASPTRFKPRAADVAVTCDRCERGGFIIRPREDGSALDLYYVAEMRCEHVKEVEDNEWHHAIYVAYSARRQAGEPLPYVLCDPETEDVHWVVTSWRWINGDAVSDRQGKL
jgi:hypothetical protein